MVTRIIDCNRLTNYFLTSVPANRTMQFLSNIMPKTYIRGLLFLEMKGIPRCLLSPVNNYYNVNIKLNKIYLFMHTYLLIGCLDDAVVPSQDRYWFGPSD